MNLDFETKKVPMETLGEYLSSVRQHLNLTLEQVANKTDVFEKFIVYLEEGKYQLLPPDVYVLGFLKKLADLYQVSYDDLLVQFKKERGIVEHDARSKILVKKSFKDKLKEISITPKLLTIGGGAALGLIAFVYVVAQVFSVNQTPNLVVSEPLTDSIVASDSVVVKGQTDPGMSVEVNGQNVFVLPDGGFETTVSVAPGQKDLQIVSRNKFGKQEEQIVSLRVEEPQVAGVSTEEPSELVVELEFTRETTITIERDGIELPEETVPAFATKRIVASEMVVVNTNDAGSTRAKLNGESLGALGKFGEELSVPFTQEAQKFIDNTNN